MPKVSHKDKHTHLIKSDKVLASVLGKGPLIKLNKRDNLYRSLLRAIVGQQLSVKAADTIWKRFEDLFPDKDPHERALLKMDIEKLRASGLSYQKAGYLKNIAEFSLKKTLDYQKLKNKSEEELIEYLTEIKGVGRWTTEMILMFSLGRENVFPADDVGIQTAMKNLYKLKTLGKEMKAEMHKIAENWHPYKTYACMYLWKWKDDEMKRK